MPTGPSRERQVALLNKQPVQSGNKPFRLKHKPGDFPVNQMVNAAYRSVDKKLPNLPARQLLRYPHQYLSNVSRYLYR